MGMENKKVKTKKNFGPPLVFCNSIVVHLPSYKVDCNFRRVKCTFFFLLRAKCLGYGRSSKNFKKKTSRTKNSLQL